MKRIGIHRTRFQQLEIWQSPRQVEFRVEGAVHAWFHRDRLLTGLAWDLIAAGALSGASRKPESILMLGLAGGTAFRVLRHLLPDCKLTAVDIDAEIVDLARQHMELDALGVEVILGDAYAWLRQNRRRFDVVIDDIYLAGKLDVYRPRGWDDALMKCLKRAVRPEGILAVNLITGAGHRRMQSATRKILKEGFAEVRSLRSPHAMNEVLVGGDRVDGRARWASCIDAFANPRDRSYWAGITSRRLGS